MNVSPVTENFQMQMYNYTTINRRLLNFRGAKNYCGTAWVMI